MELRSSQAETAGLGARPARTANDSVSVGPAPDSGLTATPVMSVASKRGMTAAPSMARTYETAVRDVGDLDRHPTCDAEFIEAEADRLRKIFRGDYASQSRLVENALGKQALALLRQLEAACLAADELAEAVEESFLQHSDAEVILSFPGLGVQLGARMLAEIGDDHKRFTDARGLKAYAGAAPVTRASGKKHHVGRRMIKNDRLNHIGYLWAFSALRSSPGAEAHYRRRREQGDWHAAAQRHLFNRMIGQLYHCLQTNQLFDEHVAFPSQLATAA